jgi:serine/threonine protein kinase
MHVRIGAQVRCPLQLLGAAKRSMLRIVPGTRLQGEKSYVVVKEIGRGGIGRVFLAREKGSGGEFAIKVISDHRFVTTPNLVARFRREVELLRSTSHPAIVKLEELIEIEDDLAIVLEYAAGGSLYAALHLQWDQGPVPLATAISWMSQLLQGVACLHAQGIVHRDLTPKNVLIRSNGSLAISDFGIARRSDDSSLTAPTDRLGSLLYISSRQRATPHLASFTDDLFSLGQIFYQIFTLIVPHGNPVSLVLARHDLPPRLVSLIESLRAFDESVRPPSAMHAHKELIDIVSEERATRLARLSSERDDLDYQAAERRQRAHLSSFVGNDDSAEASGLLEHLIGCVGPFWLPLEPSGQGWLIGGSLRLTWEDCSWDSQLIFMDYLINTWSPKRILLNSSTGWPPADFDQGALSKLIHLVNHLSEDVRKSLLAPFQFGACHRTKECCEDCGSRLIPVIHLASRPPYAAVARCEGCANSYPRCLACGSILSPIIAEDGLGRYEAVGCRNCSTVFDHRRYADRPWLEWTSPEEPAD